MGWPFGWALLGLAAMVSGAGAGAAKISPRLGQELSRCDASRVEIVWVYFADKGASAASRPATPISARALSRRARRGRTAGASAEDRPLVPAYTEAVARNVWRVRHQLRWLNAVSVEATAEQVRALESLPFVARLDLVLRWPRSVVPETKAVSTSGSPQGSHRLSYGASYDQVAAIRVPEVHDLGLSGRGVLVAMLDSGFNNLAHEALAGLEIVAMHDFVNGDDEVADGADRGIGTHGTQTLSVLAGFKEGMLVGPAHGASFILAKTEDTVSETPVEEDHWAAAAEWAESLGADVISSSLGYAEFDPPHQGYTPQDMDGQTAVCTRAAEMAAERGVVVVNSAGNEGLSAEHNTLVAPADGARVLAAAAIASDGLRASFSSVGPSADGRIKPDVAAPGVRVWAAAPFGPSGYVQVSGTSFACPLTAGVAALVLEARPGYTVDQVLAVLRGTASQAAAPDNLLGWGTVDALAAIQSQPPR
jgi:subtilisin family serine protease